MVLILQLLKSTITITIFKQEVIEYASLFFKILVSPFVKFSVFCHLDLRAVISRNGKTWLTMMQIHIGEYVTHWFAKSYHISILSTNVHKFLLKVSS